MLNQRGGVRTDTVVKLVMIFFVALLSFSVGTFVGKQVSDSDYKRASLEGEYGVGRDTASVNPDSTEMHPEKSLEDKDVASLADEFVNQEKGSNKEEAVDHKLVAQNTTTDEHEMATDAKNAMESGEYKQYKRDKEVGEIKAIRKTKPHAKTEEVTDAAERVAHDKSPSPEPKKVAAPSSVLPGLASATVGKYTVQVAAYGTENEAKSHANTLKEKGFSAFYLTATVKGHDWYRVSVGLFPDARSANNYREQLMKEANLSSAIVQKIVK